MNRQNDTLTPQITELNKLHRRFAALPKTDLKLLEAIKGRIEEMRRKVEFKPLYSLPLEGNEAFLFGLQEIEQIRSEKSFAVSQKEYEKAAKLRDKERKAVDALFQKIGIDLGLATQPFVAYEGVIYFYQLDSRIALLLNPRL